MKKDYALLLIISGFLTACSTGNEVASNYYDDGIYFDPSYGNAVASSYTEQSSPYYGSRFEDTTALPDYVYSESFEYYDPNAANEYVLEESYGSYGTNVNSAFSNINWNFIFSFGNSPYGYGYQDYGYGYPGYPSYGYPTYGYPGYGYGYPGYGYNPTYCPGNGSTVIRGNKPAWLGNMLTSNWSTVKNRTRVNGTKPGSRSGSGSTRATGPKKTNEVPERLLASNNSRSTEKVVRKTYARPTSNKTPSRVKTYQREQKETKPRATYTRVNSKPSNATSSKPNGSKVSYSKSTSVKKVAPKNYYNRTNASKGTSKSSKSTTRRYNTSFVPNKSSTRSGSKSYSSPSKSSSRSYSPSGSSRSSSGSRSSSSKSSSHSRSSGGRR